MDSHALISNLNYVGFPSGKSPTLHHEMEEPRYSIRPIICCLGPALVCGDQGFLCAAVFGSSTVFGKKQGPLELQVMCYWVRKKEICPLPTESKPKTSAQQPPHSPLPCLLEHTSLVTVLLAALFLCHIYFKVVNNS